MAPFGWDHYNAGSGEDGEEVGLTLAVKFRYELRVKVISANGLPSGNDPYAVVKLDYMTRKTRFIPNTTTPNWGEEVTEGEGGSADVGPFAAFFPAPLNLEVWDKDKFSADDHLATTKLSWRTVLAVGLGRPPPASSSSSSSSSGSSGCEHVAPHVVRVALRSADRDPGTGRRKPMGTILYIKIV